MWTLLPKGELSQHGWVRLTAQCCQQEQSCFFSQHGCSSSFFCGGRQILPGACEPPELTELANKNINTYSLLCWVSFLLVLWAKWETSNELAELAHGWWKVILLPGARSSYPFFRQSSCLAEAYPIEESVLPSTMKKQGISDLNVVFTPYVRQINMESFRGVLDLTYQKHEDILKHRKRIPNKLLY